MDVGLLEKESDADLPIHPSIQKSNNPVSICVHLWLKSL